MAIVGTGLTLADIARRLGGDQPILVDGLTNQNAGRLFGAMPMRQITGWVDQFTRIEGRPTVAFRRIGQYVAASKGQRNPYSEGVFLLSGVSEVDKIRADRDPRGPLVLRSEEDWGFLESMGYSLSYQTFYGGTSLISTVEAFDGLCTRVTSTMSTFVAAAAGCSTGDSIWAFRFGPGNFMGIYNTGPSGKLIDATDYGSVLDKDNSGSSNSVNELYRTFFNAAFGIAQYNSRSVGRISGAGGSTAAAVAAVDFTNLYAGMEAKPDLFVTTWRGWGQISALLSGKQAYPPGVTDYTPYVGSYDGIPIIVDSALVADGSM